MRVLFVFAFFFGAISTYAQNDNEVLVFSFETKPSKKMTLTHDTLTNTLIYRFASSEGIELEISDQLNDTIPIFTYSYYFRGGGIQNIGLDLNYVSFSNGAYIYKIYDEYSAEGMSSLIGITVYDESIDELTNIRGLNDSRYGSLVDFRFNELIPIVEEEEE